MIFLFISLYIFFKNNPELISIKIFLSPDISIRNQKFWVGETHRIIISKFPEYSNEKIYLTSKNNRVVIFKNNLLMRSRGKDCLIAYTNKNKINSKLCFNIYNTPSLIFNESNPLRIETSSSIKLYVNSHDYPQSNIKYQSSNPEIIKIDDKGIATALRPGKSIITASGLDLKGTEIVILSVSNNGLITNTTLDIHNAEFYKNVMIVAHPDDETLWGGANLFNERYFVVCLTNGYNLPRANDFREVLKFTKNGGIILNYPDLQNNTNFQDDWTEVKNGIIKDLSIVLSYKNWDKIVTHGPDGTTGHQHHKKICEYVTKLTKNLNKYNKLYYFGKFYQKNEIPLNLKRISDNDLKHKEMEVEIYKSEKKNIHIAWFHMLPYENWISASNLEK